MSTFPSTIRFPASASFPTTATFPFGGLTLTNIQKLSLPANTPVGTDAIIIDAIRVPAFLDDNPLAIYRPLGTENGKNSYKRFPAQINTDDGTDLNARIYYSTGDNAWGWSFGGNDQFAATGNEATPIEADWSPVAPEFITNPVLQELSAASVAVAGYFVSGANAGSGEGIYTTRGTSTADYPESDSEGRHYYVTIANNVGTPDADVSSLVWNFTSAVGGGPPQGIQKWVLYDSSGFAIVYSLSDVATPDLASNWKNASDNSPASITVTSVTQGKLDAGAQVTGAGTSSYNGPYSNRGISGSKAWFFYNKVGEATTDPDDVPPAHCIARDEDEWIINGVVGVSGYATEDDPNPYWFPFDDPVYVLQSGSAPAPVVTRNDICAEANWINT
jgi:hypothetical protein